MRGVIVLSSQCRWAIAIALAMGMVLGSVCWWAWVALVRMAVM